MQFNIFPWLFTPESAHYLFVIHNGLQLLFIWSPLLVPIIYVTRLRVVQFQIFKRYKCLLPKRLRHRIAQSFARSSTITETSTFRDSFVLSTFNAVQGRNTDSNGNTAENSTSYWHELYGRETRVPLTNGGNGPEDL